MQLCTALRLLLLCVYLNEAICLSNEAVSYSKSATKGFEFSAKATNPDDVAAVKALYSSTNGPNWRTSSGWMEGDPCSSQWSGLSCGTINVETRIVEVFLRYNNLVGNIPSEFVKLTALQSLVMSYNSLNGTLPPGIFKIPSLQTIDLASNSLSGTLPTRISLQNLIELHLDNNHFTGTITAVWDTPNLQILQLNLNQFTGNLPNGISSLRNLQELDLSQNSLTGPLNALYGKLSKLSKLWLHQNYFKYSSIPQSWSGLKSLSDIQLDRLKGHISSTIAQDCPNIERMNLGNSRLTGKIPISLCQCHYLKVIQLYNNKLQGELPDCMCSMHNVMNIDISNNQITGSIPSCIGNMTSLFEIHFARNKMTGTIPNSVGDLRLLTTFDISHNLFYGALPISLNNIVGVTYFIVNDNNFRSTGGLLKFFLSVRVQISPFFAGNCEMGDNPWKCPIPIYIPSACKASCKI